MNRVAQQLQLEPLFGWTGLSLELALKSFNLISLKTHPISIGSRLGKMGLQDSDWYPYKFVLSSVGSNCYYPTREEVHPVYFQGKVMPVFYLLCLLTLNMLALVN